MSVVTAAEVSPTVIGDLYCTVIEGCHDVSDVRRAREWTDALTRWCEAQPEIVRLPGAMPRSPRRVVVVRWVVVAGARRGTTGLRRFVQPSEPPCTWFCSLHSGGIASGEGRVPRGAGGLPAGRARGDASLNPALPCYGWLKDRSGQRHPRSGRPWPGPRTTRSARATLLGPIG